MLEQSHRQARISTPLGERALLLRSAEVEEGLSRLTEIRFEVISERDDIDPHDLIGCNVTVGIDLPDQFGIGKSRYFNGFVTRFGFGGRLGRSILYRGVAQSFFWFLTRTSDCRIFHGKTARDIAGQILQESGLGDFEFRLAREPAKYPYCVQYNESDHDFICRLMEKEGIYYFFEHENAAHKLVFVNDMTKHEPVKDYPTLEVISGNVAASTREGLRNWATVSEMRSNSVTLNAYDFTKPRADLSSQSSRPRKYDKATFERYLYPGEYVDPSVGSDYAKIRIEEEQSGGERVSGESDHRGLAAGYTFDLQGHPVASYDGSYLVVQATHSISNVEYESGGGEGDRYSNRFEAMASSETYRPPRLTPRPKIAGPQTAVVVGEGEIDADEYGSVVLRFPWARNDEVSCRVRVSQPWAGAGWGAMAIPRIGHEVIVEFLDGDPDRPIITGRVYNAKSMPAYNPKDEPTVTTIRSSSSPGGAGANEIKFDDTAAGELFFMNAWKDLELHVGEDRTETIGASYQLSVGASQIEDIGGSWHKTVGANAHLAVGASLHTDVGAMMLTNVGANAVTIAGMGMKLKSTMMKLEAKHIELDAPVISIKGSMIFIGGGMVNINSGNAPTGLPDQKPQKPEKPEKAEQTGTGEIGKMVDSAKAAVGKVATDAAALAARLIKAATGGDVVVPAFPTGGGWGGGGGAAAMPGGRCPNGYAPGAGLAPSQPPVIVLAP